MSSTPDYKSTLNKMATLEELSKFITDSSTTLGKKRGSLITMLQNMQKNIASVRSQIDAIKQSGATAKMDMQQVIQDADKKQQESLKNIQANISAMLNLSSLETATNNLNNDITALVTATTGASSGSSGSSGAPAAPSTGTWPRGQKPGGPTRGGYTYGKSRRGKGKRRRRGKNSRKKGRR